MRRKRDSEALPPWWRRALGGMSLGALALGGPWLIILAMLLFGGRFLTSRRIEADMLVLAVTYPLGPAIAGLLLGVVMPRLRRPWAAVVAGVLASLPWFAAMSLAFEPHGSRPYSVKWPVVLIMALCFGPVAGAFAHDLIPITRKRHERASRRVV
jgi:hypothetical protein